MASNITDPWVDTDVIIRLLTSEDLKKQKASSSLFEKAEKRKLILTAPATVIADCVYVLSSPRLYNLPKSKIRDLLTTLIRIPNFKVENKQGVLNALDLYASTNLDFGDAYLIATALQSKDKTIYSYDHDFDRMADIKRVEP